MRKLLARFYVSYGKGDGEELRDEYLIDDSREGREEVLDEVYYDESYESEEEFLKGLANVFQYVRFDGDWDEPTGGVITLTSKESALDGAKYRYDEEVARIERLFDSK